MEMQLDEVFDSEGTLPAVNLNLKLKVPQIWKIGDEESNLVARMVSYTSEGDAIKQVKLGDKYAHVILMSLSPKGTPAELKGGLGTNPINSINTIFETVYAQVKKLKMDAVMFRFPTKKMKGQGPIVQRVIQRLVMQKTGGRYKVVPSMYQFTGKHTYILVVRKNADIEDIKGIPDINADLYTKVESAVGDVFVSKKDGQQVTKEVAIAGSIAAVEEKRSDRTVISRTKVSRRQVAASQSLTSDVILDPSKFEEYEASAAEFSKAATAAEIFEATELKLAISSKASKENIANRAASSFAWQIAGFGGKSEEKVLSKENNFKAEYIHRLGDAETTSVKSMEAYIQTALDILESEKEEHINRFKDGLFGDDQQKTVEATKKWNLYRTKFIKSSLQSYAGTVSEQIQNITVSRVPNHYTNAEKRGIKEYVGSGYRDINNMLLGRYDPEDYDSLDKKEVVVAIKNLDDAFKRGDKLPEGTTLWRSQTVRKPIYEALVKNKVFYFRNFVSTSLYPIIFGGWKGNQGVAMTSDNTRAVLNVDKNDEGSIIPGSITADYLERNGEEGIRVNIGWAITGSEKINVVYPGSISNMGNEMEVILPRGTMLKIDKITDASYNDGMVYSNQKFIQAEVMTSEQLDEAVVYDGDALLESGELVTMDADEAPVSFASFSSSGIKAEEKRKVLGLLASFIDLADTPPKFVE